MGMRLVRAYQVVYMYIIVNEVFKVSGYKLHQDVYPTFGIQS